MKKDCSECEYFDEFHTSRVCHDCKPWGESAEAVHGWIPCSDRLPSESGTYLVTTAKGAVWADHFYANSVDDRHWSYRTRRVPIAWMPLPTPYKGGDDE